MERPEHCDMAVTQKSEGWLGGITAREITQHNNAVKQYRWFKVRALLSL